MTDKIYDWDTIREDLQIERKVWVIEAACAERDTNIFYDEEAKAKVICKLCTVRNECLEYALGFREEFGVWGAASEVERKRLLRKARVLYNERDDLSLRDCVQQVVKEFTPK